MMPFRRFLLASVEVHDADGRGSLVRRKADLSGRWVESLQIWQPANVIHSFNRHTVNLQILQGTVFQSANAFYGDILQDQTFQREALEIRNLKLFIKLPAIADFQAS